MLLFGAASLLAGVGIGGGNARFLGHNLSCFLVYIWARTYEGQEVAVMEFFTIRAEPCGTQETCLLYTSPSPRDATLSRMPSSA